jgi:hypothetical protein
VGVVSIDAPGFVVETVGGGDFEFTGGGGDVGGVAEAVEDLGLTGGELEAEGLVGAGRSTPRAMAALAAVVRAG